MVAVSLCLNEYKSYESDIIITDRIANSVELVNSLRKIKLFRNILFIPLNKLFRIRNKFSKLFMLYIKHANILTNYSYDSFLFANFSIDVNIIYKNLVKKNKAIKVYMFEDGYATYSKYYGTTLAKISGNSTLFNNIIHSILNPAFHDVKGIYLFSPSLLTYTPEFKIIKMNAFDSSSLSIFNKIFKYDELKDKYQNKKVIFFEESYFADGIKTEDIQIVEKISNIVGKDNIIIKIHPRNPVNRFKELGYTTNINTNIPWEVIALNMDLSNKILVTIASVAAIVPKALLGKKYTGILLMNLLEDKSCLKKDIIPLYKKICDQYSTLYIVNSWEEIDAIMKNNGVKL